MQKEIKLRRDFEDVDITKTAYLTYELFDEVPDYTDFKFGECRTIVLRNAETGQLERIEYKLSGGITHHQKPKAYVSYWGDMLTYDYHCCLVFNFNNDGDCTEITASFCAPSMSHERFEEISKDISYPAEITNRYGWYEKRETRK